MSKNNEKQNSVTEAVRAKSRGNLSNDVFIILPLRNTVLLPSIVTPLSFGRPASVRAVQEAIKQELPLGVVVQKDPGIDAPRPEDIYRIGTTADILRKNARPLTIC